MKTADRKAVIAAYKERKPSAGIYAVRCAASGEVWVGRAPDLDKIQNRIWFTLRQGNHPEPTLQSALRAHGIEKFSFEVLERAPEEELDFARDAALKKSLERWRKELGATAI